MIQSFLCIPHILVGYAGGTTPRMEEVEQCREQLPTTARMQEVGRKPLLRFLHSPLPCGLATQEQLPRAPTVGALGDAGAIADDCKDTGGRQKTAPAFSAFATSLWFSNAGAVADQGNRA